MDLSGAVVLVTGGSSGIGAASAVALAGRGARVLVSGRDAVALDEVARTCGGTALPADLSTAEACAELAGRALAVHGQVDVLVSSAGIGAAGPFAQLAPAMIEELVRVNLLAPALLARALLPGMLERGRGHLLLVGSIAGLTGVADEATYAATKGGLSILAESLRLELHDRGIGVSTVIPGVVATAFFERRGVAYGRRWPRPVPPERIASAVVRAVERNRAETIVPRWLSSAPRARGLAPAGYRFLARRFGKN